MREVEHRYKSQRVKRSSYWSNQYLRMFIEVHLHMVPKIPKAGSPRSGSKVTSASHTTMSREAAACLCWSISPLAIKTFCFRLGANLAGLHLGEDLRVPIILRRRDQVLQFSSYRNLHVDELACFGIGDEGNANP